ncbi:uncharacterized protein LOC106664320 isoform X2 [Cimex lectularius]|uniref:THAP-type domain-containing protein n=1 Tax=Cimex lectularius TaxID=79782 RepID=A0A8I6RH78_CIMLE|nr:uncharacterized protein LOC106664320 isoform X2 [Cimex lectularius]
MVNNTRCCVPNCKDSRSAKRVLPVFDEKVYNIWVDRIGNPILEATEPQIVHKRYRVCDRHFSDYCRIPGSKKLKVGSLPTLHLPKFCEVPSYENSIFKHSNQTSVPSFDTLNFGDSNDLPFDFNVNELLSKLISSEPSLADENILLNCEKELEKLSANAIPDDGHHPNGDISDFAALEKLILQQLDELEQSANSVSNIPYWEPENFDESYLEFPEVDEVPAVTEPTTVPEANLAADLATLTPMDIQLVDVDQSNNMVFFAVEL